MGSLEQHFYDIGYLDTLAGQDTFVHRLDPRAKLFTTLLFIGTVVSFGKYEISALVPFIAYPVYLLAAGNLPVGYVFKKVLLVSPFAVLVGVFNPFLDHVALLRIGHFAISGGWVSFFSILMRFALTVSAAIIFVAVTGFNNVCMSLEKLGAPRFIAVQMLFLYRYLFVLMEEAARMIRARSLRTFNGKGLGFASYSSLLGHLLLRTLDRAQRIHSAMWCRGFEGVIRTMKPLTIGHREITFVSAWTAFFVAMRFINFPIFLGSKITGFWS